MERQLYAEHSQTHNGYIGNRPVSRFTLRDLLAIGFRRQRLVVLSFVVIFALASAVLLLLPAKYEAQMKILVKRERVDPLVTPDETSQQPFLLGVTEEELNSEVELLKSRDLLTQVVEDTRLHERKDTGIGAWLNTLLRRPTGETVTTPEKDQRIAAAVQQIAGQLGVQPLRRSNVIQVSYASQDPDKSAQVLKTLAERYLEKHLAVHRPSGAFDFFDTETERYSGQLVLAQARLNDQNNKEGVVSVQVEREQALRRLGEFEVAEQTTEAQIADAAARIKAIQAQLASTPARTTTVIRRGSAELLAQLNSTLVAQELKRIELLRAFQPSYPLVQDVESQIAKVKDAIAAAEASPLVEESSDRNPTYEQLIADLARSRAELAGLQARANAATRSLSLLRERARQLEHIGMAQQTLVRAATQAEQSFMIYSRKREEARISNALDKQRILNVAIAEAAMVPFAPSGPSRLLLLLLGALLAGGVSVLLACVVDYADPSFRTPEEVQTFLGQPVLAAFPRDAA